MKNTLFLSVCMALLVAVMVSFTYDQQVKPWKIPAKYLKMTNTEEPTKESLKIGKRLWKKHCASCHGSDGLGDGSKAAQLDTPAGDFSTEAFQSQSDGEMFYKSWIGRDEMPNYEKKIPYEEDVWHIVNYMRTMGE